MVPVYPTLNLSISKLPQIELLTTTQEKKIPLQKQ